MNFGNPPVQTKIFSMTFIPQLKKSLKISVIHARFLFQKHFKICPITVDENYGPWLSQIYQRIFSVLVLDTLIILFLLAKTSFDGIYHPRLIVVTASSCAKLFFMSLPGASRTLTDSHGVMTRS